MAPKKPVPFTPSPNNIRVNSIKELGGKLDYNSLSPIDKLAIKLVVGDYLRYLLTEPKFKERLELRGLGGIFDDTSSENSSPDK